MIVAYTNRRRAKDASLTFGDTYGFDFLEIVVSKDDMVYLIVNKLPPDALNMFHFGTEYEGDKGLILSNAKEVYYGDAARRFRM